MQPSGTIGGVTRPGAVDRAVLALHDLRGRRLPWLALAFGTGIGAYFALPVEPGAAAALALSAATAMLLVVAYLTRHGIGFLALWTAVALGGVLAGQARTALVAAPVLDFRYYGAVEGRIRIVDRSASGAVRLTLDRVRLDGVPRHETPARVRVSLHGEGGAVPALGTWVMTTAHLSPPAGPTEPGGFDFQRHAFFQGLGALGYTRLPLLRIAPPEGGAALAVLRARMAIGTALRNRLPGQQGAVAAAITTGDRSHLSDEVVADLRASNLAHLLAISGLHMGLLVGFVFWAVRGGLALIPRIALTRPTKQWAAATALPFALAYLFLSGGTVATQRAFVMAAVMLGAVLVGQRVLSIRSVAIAALLILAWHPESLIGPGFQMSFAATGALVLAFRALSGPERSKWMTGWRGVFVSLLLSSIVAGAATAPFAAYHFNRIGQFGVLANLLAVPAMGFAVMPMLLLALLLWPIGLEGPPLAIAGAGIGWILEVAARVADMPGAVRTIAAPDPWVLPLLGVGMTVIGCAIGRTRLVGVAVLMVAGALWLQGGRAEVLIAETGRLVGITGPEGRWLDREKGAGFTAEAWLENDGDPTGQAAAATRERPDLEPLPAIHIARGKRDLPAELDACRRSNGWLVTPLPFEGAAETCRVIDSRLLRRTGSIALTVKDGVVVETHARAVQGRRPWVPGTR
ncbi:ComEC/Rec2 family competence protein [uncultured Jannaschia sp.]|uniref:ComEC/Rec2 family competence protein n=1 Tax=uncultured Jannaschia sp. TaxID=293347 RepID=UPI0026076A89|nr:ComEC/Rec2 family competence protein [uncultured Jannaschia sp.]